MPIHETRRRSIVKSITYRTLNIVTDLAVVYLITHRYDITIAVMVFTNLVSTLMYFLHERTWNTINWGRYKTK